MKYRIFDAKGAYIAAISALLSLILFYTDTGSFWGSFLAALIAAAWFWMTYAILRWLLLAFKK